MILCHHLLAQTATIPSQWKLMMKDDLSFKEIKVDESSWQTVTVPASWTKLGINKEKTTAWYRVNIAVPENLLNKDLILFAGTIDDADETYFNGKLIGATGQFPPEDQSAWDAERKYIIPAALVKPQNTIAIRVYNGIGDGGIYGGRIMLMAKKDYDKEVVNQIKNKKSYYKLTTSNGLAAAVYNEQTQAVDNFYPHIFSYYDSGLVVKPIFSNLKFVLNEQPILTHYLKNTHVVEVRYPSFNIYYYTSFIKQDKIFYAVIRGTKSDIDKINFTYEKVSGAVIGKTLFRKTTSGFEKYFAFGFSDTLNALPNMDDAIKSVPTPEQEVNYMTQFFASCKIPSNITLQERNVVEQGITVLKMSQVGEKEVLPFAKGQVVASLRPGVWAISWVRDGAFSIEAMSKLGMYAEAKKFLEFMLNAKPTNQFIHYVHTDGMDYGLGVPYIVSLTRYFGNGREECDYTTDGGPNIEMDDLGLFLTACYFYVQQSKDVNFLKKWDNELRIIGNAIVFNINEKNIIRRDSGPWEHHLPGKEFMWTSGTCARGLELMSQLQKQYGLEYQTFESAAQRIKKGILQNCLVAGKFIKGNATEQLNTDHHYYDAATFELFAGGLIKDKKLFASHMAEYNQHNRAMKDANRGYIRFNSSDSYENQEWSFAGLRVAVAQNHLGSKVEAKKMINRITTFANRNHNLVPEILTNDMNLYSGAIPMVGYGSAAYVLAVLDYYNHQ